MATPRVEKRSSSAIWKMSLSHHSCKRFLPLPMRRSCRTLIRAGRKPKTPRSPSPVASQLERNAMLGRKGSFAIVMVAAIAALAAAIGCIGGEAQAQIWPQRPVRIIVPYAAGGNSDGMARIVAQRLTEAFGQTFVVENRLGANGAIAAEAVARSAGD